MKDRPVIKTLMRTWIDMFITFLFEFFLFISSLQLDWWICLLCTCPWKLTSWVFSPHNNTLIYVEVDVFFNFYFILF